MTPKRDHEVEAQPSTRSEILGVNCRFLNQAPEMSPSRTFLHHIRSTERRLLVAVSTHPVVGLPGNQGTGLKGCRLQESDILQRLLGVDLH